MSDSEKPTNIDTSNSQSSYEGGDYCIVANVVEKDASFGMARSATLLEEQVAKDGLSSDGLECQSIVERGWRSGVRQRGSGTFVQHGYHHLFGNNTTISTCLGQKKKCKNEQKSSVNFERN